MTRRVLMTLLAMLIVAPVAAQPKRDDPLQTEQRKLQQTQKQLKQDKRKAAKPDQSA